MKKGIFFKSISYVLIGLLVFNCFFHCPSKAYADDSSKYKGFVPFEIIDDNLEVDGVDCMLIGHNGLTYENDTNYYSYYEIISKDKESCIIKPDMNTTTLYFSNLILNILHGSVGNSVLYNDSKMKNKSFEEISAINLNTEWLNLAQELSSIDNFTYVTDNNDSSPNWYVVLFGIAGTIVCMFSVVILLEIGWTHFNPTSLVDWGWAIMWTVMAISAFYFANITFDNYIVQEFKKENEEPRFPDPYSLKVNLFNLKDKKSNFEIENFSNKKTIMNKFLAFTIIIMMNVFKLVTLNKTIYKIQMTKRYLLLNTQMQRLTE